ncbi:MAG: TIGR04255 family protein [bacterium]
MARVRHLRKAPILEALIDFRVTLPKDFDVDQFKALTNAVGERYPIVEAMHHYETSVTFQPGRPPDTHIAEQHPGGYAFRSPDRLSVAQFRRDGFTYNRLQPYTSWNELHPEVVRLWGLYQGVARPETCTRISARYINKIDIPVAGGELSDYLTAPPGIPKGVSDKLTAFLTRVIIQVPKQDLTGSITQASQVQLDPQSAAVILDIEVYRQSDSGMLHQHVEPTLARLHDMKNTLFFGSLTADLIKRYE